jgi:hypothetical protein
LIASPSFSTFDDIYLVFGQVALVESREPHVAKP